MSIKDIEIPEFRSMEFFKIDYEDGRKETTEMAWHRIAHWSEYNWNRTNIMLMKKKEEVKEFKIELYDLKKDNKYLEEDNKRLEKENKRLYKEMMKYRKELNYRKADLK